MSDQPSSERGRPRAPTQESAPDILLPDEPPDMNPAAARALVRILLRAYRATLPPTQ